MTHNASFDRRVLPEMHGDWICTIVLSRQLWLGIKYAAPQPEAGGDPPADLYAHRALYDCYVTTALLSRIMETSG